MVTCPRVEKHFKLYCNHKKNCNCQFKGNCHTQHFTKIIECCFIRSMLWIKQRQHQLGLLTSWVWDLEKITWVVQLYRVVDLEDRKYVYEAVLLGNITEGLFSFLFVHSFQYYFDTRAAIKWWHIKPNKNSTPLCIPWCPPLAMSLQPCSSSFQLSQRLLQNPFCLLLCLDSRVIMTLPCGKGV